MTRTIAWMLAAILLGAAPGVAAQTPSAPATPPQDAAPPPPPAMGQPVNIRVVLTITDERAGQPAEKKTVTLLTADGVWGRVRAEGQVQRQENRPVVPVQLNVDARPVLTEGGLVRLELNLQHQLVQAGHEGPTTHPTRLVEGLTVFLRSGVPLIISEAVDPASGRQTTVEVTATALK